MMFRTIGQTSGSRAIPAKVARLNALMGLNATLPSNLTQISFRMRVVTGQRRPDAIKASAIERALSDRLPSGSPSEIRFPSV
jgi:hypothetical protein